MKYLIALILQVTLLSFSYGSSNTSFFNTATQDFIKINQEASIKSSKALCNDFSQLSLKLEKLLFNKSCPNASELDFMLCHQTSDNLTSKETKTLQQALFDLNKINGENCSQELPLKSILTKKLSEIITYL